MHRININNSPATGGRLRTSGGADMDLTRALSGVPSDPTNARKLHTYVRSLTSLSNHQIPFPAKAQEFRS